MNELLATVLRAALKWGGGFLLAKGIANETQWLELSSAAMTAFGILWGILAAKKARRNNPEVPPSQKLNVIKSVAWLLLPTFLFLGCKSTLEKGGAYAPGTFVVSTNTSGVVSTNFVATSAADRGLYEADLAYDLAHALIDGAFKFEKDNRQALWNISPSIKHALDGIRPRAWEINVQWAKARQAYLKHPTPGDLNTLQQLLGQLQQLADAASTVIQTK